MKPPVFITGYMASGKTTFGRALARALHREFIDLDFYIEQRFRRTVGTLFEEEGEEGFRRRESAMLREAGEFDGTVIACGGGTPCFNGNTDFMLSRGTVVFLDSSPECICRRLEANNTRRPLMAGKSSREIREAVAEGLARRMPHYRRATVTLSGDRLENRSEIDGTVAAFIAAHPGI